jgi:uncharacterized protein
MPSRSRDADAPEEKKPRGRAKTRTPAVPDVPPAASEPSSAAAEPAAVPDLSAGAEPSPTAPDVSAGADDPGEAPPDRGEAPSPAVQAEAILWRRLDQPGHDFARLSLDGGTWYLRGTALLVHDRRPCRFDYQVACDSQWRTSSGRVTGWFGSEAIDVEITVDGSRRWRLNGELCPSVEGCVDLDLVFSPSTNLIAIRRLGLAIGQEAHALAAWLKLPDFSVERLDQVYRRIDDAAYRYESAGFVTELQVNKAGFVTRYPGFWEIATG